MADNIFIDDEFVDPWLDKQDVVEWLQRMLQKPDRLGDNATIIRALLRLFDGIPYNMTITEIRCLLETNIVLRNDGTG